MDRTLLSVHHHTALSVFYLIILNPYLIKFVTGAPARSPSEAKELASPSLGRKDPYRNRSLFAYAYPVAAECAKPIKSKRVMLK